MKRKHVRIQITMVNQYFNAYFISTNYRFVMSSPWNIVKSFETVIYMPKIEIRWACNDLLKYLLVKWDCSAYQICTTPDPQNYKLWISSERVEFKWMEKNSINLIWD